MAITFTRVTLSGATNNKPTGIDATTSPGTTLHTAGTTGIDVLNLTFVNRSTVTASGSQLFIEFGGTASAEVIPQQFLGQERFSLANLMLSASTSILRAYATASGRFACVGYVNRIV